MEIIGWIGAFCFAVCAIPQAWMCYRNGHANGMSPYLLILWAGGEICTLAYVLPKGDWPLIFNYLCNMVSLGVICLYKLKPRRP